MLCGTILMEKGGGVGGEGHPDRAPRQKAYTKEVSEKEKKEGKLWETTQNKMTTPVFLVYCTALVLGLAY